MQNRVMTVAHGERRLNRQSNRLRRAGRVCLAVFAFFALLNSNRAVGVFTLGPQVRMESPLRGMVVVGPLYGLAALGAVLWLTGVGMPAVFQTRRVSETFRVWVELIYGRVLRSRAGVVSGLLAVLIVLALIRLCCAPDPVEALLAVAALAVLAGTFAFVVIERPEAHQVAKLTVAAAAIHAAVGVAQFLRQADAGLWFLGEARLDPALSGISVLQIGEERVLRAYGLMPHPNNLGALLAMGLIAAVELWVWTERRQRYVWLASAALILAGLALSFSRAAWLGGAAALAGLGMSHKPVGGFSLNLERPNSRLRLWAFLLALVGCQIGLLAVWKPELFWVRLTAASPLEYQSLWMRGLGIQTALQIIQEHWWWGVGTRHYLEAAARLTGQPPTALFPVHNVPLLLWAENGLGAAAAWIALGLFTLALGWRQIVRSQDRRTLAGLSLATAWMVCIQVVSLFGYSYAPTQNLQAPLWLGLTCGLWAASCGFDSDPAPAERLSSFCRAAGDKPVGRPGNPG